MKEFYYIFLRELNYSLSETSIMFWQALSDSKSLMPVV